MSDPVWKLKGSVSAFLVCFSLCERRVCLGSLIIEVNVVYLPMMVSQLFQLFALHGTRDFRILLSLVDNGLAVK
jgi:hypothetical protein